MICYIKNALLVNNKKTISHNYLQKNSDINMREENTSYDYITEIAGLSNEVEGELFKNTSGEDIEKLLNEIERVQSSVKKTK